MTVLLGMLILYEHKYMLAISYHLIINYPAGCLLSCAIDSYTVKMLPTVESCIFNATIPT